MQEEERRRLPNVRCQALVIALGTLLLCSQAQAFQVVGIGTLLGNDLTDIGDDGVPGSYNPPGNLGGFDATFFSSARSGFGQENAFNVFDNRVGPTGTFKWCCGFASPTNDNPPWIVGADFGSSAFFLTHFTVTSANDAAYRDPRVWSIEGSNDGVAWTPIFVQNNPAAALWTDRLQVLRFDEGVDFPTQTQAYSMFRMITTATGRSTNDRYQLNEIEFFGVPAEGFCGDGVVGDGEECDDGNTEDGDGCESDCTVLLQVDIDIKPGLGNAINPLGLGLVPVAILGSESFDVADVDPATLAFGPAGAAPDHKQGAHDEDVDGDGIADLVSHYPIPETGIEAGDTQACVTGELLDATPFEGCDTIRTVGRRCGLGWEVGLLAAPLLAWRRRRRAGAA